MPSPIAAHSSTWWTLLLTVLLGGDERQQKFLPLNWLHLTGKDVSL